MYLAKVIGSTVATQKDPRLEGAKLMVVQLVTPDGEDLSDLHVAVDTAGAGVGSLVVVTIGSGARLTEQTRPMPVDAAIVAIVDSLEKGGNRVYSAGEGFVGQSTQGVAAGRRRLVNLARVIGKVVAVRRAPNLREPLLLLVQPLDEDLCERGTPIVAVDSIVSAGHDELVFYVSGSDATGALTDRFQPVDAAIVGFVDSYQPAAAARGSGDVLGSAAGTGAGAAGAAEAGEGVD